MSAPTKAEMLEDFAQNLGMTRLEMLEFCWITLTDVNDDKDLILGLIQLAIKLQEGMTPSTGS